jgi:hypothetical protein
VVVEIPVCPGCGCSGWESVERYVGGEKLYQLGADGWALVDDSLELDETDYYCRDCGYDPGGEGNHDLVNVLNEIETAAKHS